MPHLKASTYSPTLRSQSIRTPEHVKPILAQQSHSPKLLDAVAPSSQVILSKCLTDLPGTHAAHASTRSPEQDEARRQCACAWRVHVGGVGAQEGGFQDGQVPPLRGGAGAPAAGGHPAAAVLPRGRQHSPLSLGGGRDRPHLRSGKQPSSPIHPRDTTSYRAVNMERCTRHELRL